jgi:putative endonuclease
MIFTVYILYSEKFNKHYTGFTSSISQRLKSHNEFGYDWTARYRPWKIIYVKDFQNQADAMNYEKWLKSGKGRAFAKTLQH